MSYDARSFQTLNQFSCQSSQETSLAAWWIIQWTSPVTHSNIKESLTILVERINDDAHFSLEHFAWKSVPIAIKCIVVYLFWNLLSCIR